ncbi:MAG: response regulator [Chloroflexota bacterium]|nr:response regulator [Chloroflexota bacterium]
MDGRVLIIEDNSGNCQVLQKYLGDAGMQVEVSHHGVEGLSLALQHLPQAIIVSTTLPDMSGSAVVEQLREKASTRHIFVMLLADTDVHRERLNALDIGADDFIASPFDPDEVVLRVRNALRRVNTSNLTDPITGLPAGKLIQEQLRRVIKSPEGEWALLRAHIRGLESFRESYGLQAASDFLRGMGQVIAVALSKDTVADDFLGYGGHDDFIVFTHRERIASLRATVEAQFKKEVKSHYNFKDRQRGFILIDGQRRPLAVLRVHCITPQDGPFYDIRSLSEALAG